MRLLLVSPAFHGYWRSIRDAFEQLGYDVDVHVYDAAPRTEKIYNKLRYEALGRLRGEPQHLSRSRVTDRALEAVRSARPDALLVVRGDVLSEAFWEAASTVVPRRALWLYDELRRMSFDPDVVETFAPVASYSAEDVRALQGRGVDAYFVPLAFDPTRDVAPPRARTSELTFIGARFGRRVELIEALIGAGFQVRCYGRDWSAHPIDRARTFRVRRSGVPSGRDLPLETAWAVMRDSLGTLNVHGDQDGFTMRTFEACGVGAVQLLDRTDVTGLYDPGREVLTFSDADELLDQARRLRAAPADFEPMRAAARRRTLAEHTFVHRAQALERLWA